MLHVAGKRLLTVMAIILVFSAIIAVYSYVNHTYTRAVVGGARSYDLSRVNSLIKFYAIGGLPASVESLFRSVGINLVHLLPDHVPAGFRLESNSFILISVQEAGHKPLSYFNTLINLLSNNSNHVIALINKDPKAQPFIVFDVHGAVYKALSKVYGENARPIIVCDPEDPALLQVNNTEKPRGCKIHSAMFKADLVAINTNPPGTVIVENLDERNVADAIVFILKALLPNNVFAKLEPLLPRELIPSTSIIDEPKDMVILGTVGWITNYTRGKACGEVTGYQSFYIRYYYSNVTSATGALYHVFYSYIVHSGKGYQTTCGWSTINHYPKAFATVTHWRTDAWPGQVLDDWGPKNVGTARTISYTTIAGIAVGKDFSATIQYSTGFTEPNAPYYTWMDESDPGFGRVATRHEVERGGWPEDKLSNKLFTVEPSSFGYLDPNKPGGKLPMIIYHSLYMELNTGDNVNVTLSVYLYNNNYLWKVG